ncbi:MAG: hypothetical protein ACOX2K_01370 [Bacillota bacterium]
MSRSGPGRCPAALSATGQERGLAGDAPAVVKGGLIRGIFVV